jgi:hypothetical protein
LILVAAVGSLLTASVAAGIALAPSPLVFLEHVALGLAIRAAYKSIGGWNWADWSFGAEPAAEAPAEAALLHSSSGAAANSDA